MVALSLCWPRLHPKLLLPANVSLSGYVCLQVIIPTNRLLCTCPCRGAAMSRNKPENLMIESLDPGPLPHTPGAALHSSLQQGAHSGADSVRMPRAASMDGGKHAATPIDVETLVYKNTDKLQMLKVRALCWLLSMCTCFKNLPYLCSMW